MMTLAPPPHIHSTHTRRATSPYPEIYFLAVTPPAKYYCYSLPPPFSRVFYCFVVPLLVVDPRLMLSHSL